MDKKTIVVSLETKENLDLLRKRYKSPTYNHLLYSICTLVLENRIDIDNPNSLKENKYVVKEQQKAIDELYKKLSANDQSLRKWLGHILAEYIKPIHINTSLIQDVFNKDISNSEVQEVQKEEVLPKESPTKIPNEYDENILRKTQNELTSMYEKNKVLSEKLNKIFASEKVETVGMLGTTKRIVIEMPFEEWNKLKN